MSDRHVHRAGMSRRDWAVLAVAVAVGIPVVVAAALDSTKHPSASAAPAVSASASPAEATSAGHTPKAKAQPVSGPTFRYAGDRECAITYRDRGDGSMSWTATVTVQGDLKTHVSDQAGNLYSHDVQVQSGLTSLAAPFSLTQLSDIGGVLYALGASYSCSIAPAASS